MPAFVQPRFPMASRVLCTISVALLTALAVAAPAAAQDTPPAAAAPPAPAAPDASPPALAAAPPTAPAWAMICGAAPQAETEAAPCAITQMLVAAPGGPRVLQVSIRPAALARATPPGATGQPPGSDT